MVDAALLESHKENIQPLSGGRPASKLGMALNHDMDKATIKSQRQLQREKFEKELQKFDELDDPLQVYCDYVSWTHTTYPQGSNTESGLLSLLERCTSQFRDVLHYKNDPRYLKLWLQYKDYSDSPRDIFVYLAKKDIGTSLALYYEEFANYLEIQGNIRDAEEIYTMGIQAEARPLKRLERSYVHFKDRTSTDTAVQDDSERSIGNVLSLKRGGENRDNESHVALGEGYGDTNNNTNIRKKPKLQVFNDEDDEQNVLQQIFSSTTDSNIGTIKLRTKENQIAAKPWSGEVIKQQLKRQPLAAKIPVFRDTPSENDVVGADPKNDMPEYTTEELLSGGPIYTTVRYPGKKPERVHINMDLIYPVGEEECCLDEVFAMKWQQQMNSSLKLQEEAKVSVEEENYITEKSNSLTIPLKDEDEDSTLPNNNNRPNSPTMTMFSRMATNEVLTMFNDAANNLNSEDEEGKTDFTEDNTTNYDGFVTETIQNPLTNNRVETPALETQKTPPTDHYDSSDGNSSPFIERPSAGNIDNGGVLGFQTYDPMDEVLRDALLSRLPVDISSYPGFYDYSTTRMSKLVKFPKITNDKSHLIQKGAKDSIINYCGNEIFCLRYELGKGGYGTVYLVETETGEFKAMKIESPATKWEFYILCQIHRRLQGFAQSARSMIIQPESLYYFADESYLTMNYANKGTLLDVVNYFKDQGSVVDEALVIFLTIELLRSIEILHNIGIIHGDLKADNCMIRLVSDEDEEKLSEEFNRSKSSGWNDRGITLIDFGRAIDLTLFHNNKSIPRFVSHWKSEQQDCPQMNKGEPWSYEADYYGVASIIHTLLFGKYIEIQEKQDGKYKLSNNLKRYWQVELWAPLFETLLNPPNPMDLPAINDIQRHRSTFEKWLEENSKSRGLKQVLLGIEQEFGRTNRRLLKSLQ
ncbi:checkpoint serine/threonine-protein kinase Bub1p [[Candida] anglica]|uniref:Checkpoint serine/threonine-protein kinase Bub1p n=1 Tax=[Candida] anglica TaxID=148631 RepID=A0ABP0EMU6_9ASCO